MIEVTHAYVWPYHAAAVKAGVPLLATRNTRWFRSEGHEGFCGIIHLNPARCRIKGIWVHPEYRHGGVAGRLVKECIAWASAAGFREVEQIVSDRGRDRYAAMGFQLIGRTGAGYNRILLTLE